MLKNEHIAISLFKLLPQQIKAFKNTDGSLAHMRTQQINPKCTSEQELTPIRSQGHTQMHSASRQKVRGNAYAYKHTQERLHST